MNKCVVVRHLGPKCENLVDGMISNNLCEESQLGKRPVHGFKASSQGHIHLRCIYFQTGVLSAFFFIMILIENQVMTKEVSRIM